jgi:hypothetical protein
VSCHLIDQLVTTFAAQYVGKFEQALQAHHADDDALPIGVGSVDGQR